MTDHKSKWKHFFCDMVILKICDIFYEKEKGNNKYMAYYYY